jgi:hypothetical protein
MAKIPKDLIRFKHKKMEDGRTVSEILSVRVDPEDVSKIYERFDSLIERYKGLESFRGGHFKGHNAAHDDLAECFVNNED